MTLKTVLRNFLNHVETIEARRQIAEDQFDSEFQKLKELTEKLKHHTDFTVNEGELEVNRRKNRYKDILPYDHTRVVVSEYPGVPGSDYVNANYIKGASGSLAYIASQGPLPNTVADFWRMIWECEVQVIVMACNERESGKYKCEGYWPNEEGEKERQYGNITVELVKWRQVCPDFLVRTLKYRCLGEDERSLCQFHYTTWPDHGVPTTVQPILDMVRLMRDCQASEAVPILIHCSAGCGRTGTICAIDYVWSLMRLGKLYEGFNLYEIVSDMRKQRIAMVQTKEQYILVHRAVSALFEQQLRVIDNHTYENLDGDGQPLMLKELQNSTFPNVEHIYEDVRALMALEKDPKRHRPLSTTYSVVRPNMEGKLNHTYENVDDTSMLKMNGGDPNTHQNKDPEILPRRRNSQILQKLCQEESVKRLISGWNKPDSLPTSDVEVAPLPKPEETSCQTEKFVTNTPKHVNDHISPSEKLIGKATVIRRPSIAKLKALFEKSHGSDQNEDERRRIRPLGRSHSHHVARGRVSPSSDNSESETRRGVERERSMRRMVSPLAREVASRSKPKEIMGNGDCHIVEPTKKPQEQQQQQQAQHHHTMWYKDDMACPDVKLREQSALRVGCLELRTDKTSSWYGEHESMSISRSKWYDEQKPPELPLKKKFLNIKQELRNGVCNPVPDKKEVSTSKAVSEVAPRTIGDDSAAPPRLPEKKVLGRNASIKHKQRNEMLLNRIDGKVQSRKSVCIPLSDVEKQNASTPKKELTLSKSFKLKVACKDTIADRYTNVNLTTQKNMAQIENTIKCHPRGAIIDLTSRTSFVEQVQPPPIGSSTNKIISYGTNIKGQKPVDYETVWMKEAPTENNSDKTTDVIPDDNKQSEGTPPPKPSREMEVNKNLLLHSPPPRSRRPHTKTNKAKPDEESIATTATDKNPNISSDQEINKAVKDLNTIGYLLDALATQTLEDLKKENPLPDNLEVVKTETEKPTLPAKQKSIKLPHTLPSKQTEAENTSTTVTTKPAEEPIYHEIAPSLADMPVIERPPAISRDYEYLYPLQKSASAPHPGKMYPGVLSAQQPTTNMSKDRHLSYYQSNKNYDLSGPPKPPRTFTHIPQPVKYDGGRLIVSVASPKSLKPGEIGSQQPNMFRYDTTSCASKSYSSGAGAYTYPENFQQNSMESYCSQPTSPLHSSYPPVTAQGIRNPQPLSYRTYPSYPEIHSVRVTPHHLPLDPSSLHLIRPSLAAPPYGHFNKHQRNSELAGVMRGHTLGAAYRYSEDKSHHNSAIPDYGEVPVVPVYTMIRQPEGHRVQWDSSVDEQQQVKGSKTLSSNYENIYDVPKECATTDRLPNNSGPVVPNYDPTAYAVVNKGPPQPPHRQGHELRHSQSDASVYTVLRGAKKGEMERPSQPPLYSQVMKPKKSQEQNQRHRRSRDDMDLQPMAPPRNKRQVNARRSVADGGLCEQGFPIDSQSTWQSDSEEEPPAVPAKTKGAYIVVDTDGRKVSSVSHTRKVSRDGVPASSQGGLGGTLSRALGKLNLLTKLSTNKAEVNEQQQQLQQQGRCIERTNDVTHPKETSPTKKHSSSATTPPGLRSPIFGFPHRMHRRPKGPREPPEQWTQV